MFQNTIHWICNAEIPLHTHFQQNRTIPKFRPIRGYGSHLGCACAKQIRCRTNIYRNTKHLHKSLNEIGWAEQKLQLQHVSANQLTVFSHAWLHKKIKGRLHICGHTSNWWHKLGKVPMSSFGENARTSSWGEIKKNNNNNKL